MKENPFCSCCLSVACYKNMSNEFANEKSKETYSNMFINTFNIDVTNLGCTALICDTCIIKLRAASAFKEQVLSSQRSIRRQWNKLKSNMDFKIELDDDDFDDKIGDDIGDSNFMWDIQPSKRKGQVFVIKLEPKENKIPAKVSTSITPTTTEHVSNTLHVTTKTSTVLQSTKKVTKTANKCNKSLKKKLVTKNRKPSIKTVITTKKLIKTVTAKPKKGDRKFERLPITQSEIDARENTLKLIQNSNLCLFRSLKTKYGCFMCKASFVDSSKLREHSITHTNTTLLYRISKCRGLSYKNADISELNCSICSENIVNLNELIKHLNEKHAISFCNTNHFLVPYRLNEDFHCVLCNLKFHSFLRLSIHMNSHYTNNVCEICGLPFINRVSLRTHVQSQHREKKCRHCPAKFLTVSLKAQHLRKVHNIFSMKRYCNLCDKTFPYTYVLEKHKIEEHGAKKTIVNCKDCGKTFCHEANLKVHIRSVHLKERNYPCEVCGTRFFTKCDQKRHQNTHEEYRPFSCSYCEFARFKSKDSWRRHVRKQHGDVST